MNPFDYYDTPEDREAFQRSRFLRAVRGVGIFGAFVAVVCLIAIALTLGGASFVGLAVAAWEAVTS